MAAEPTSKPVYHSPTSFTRGRQRRSSTRQSFTLPTLPPGVESPRTLCPKDGDTFSYKPSLLPEWYIPQELWERLPSQFQAILRKMQLAGAAVLTGFQRAQKHNGDTELSPAASSPEMEVMTQLDDSICSLPAPMLRSTSDASSRFSSSFGSPALMLTPSSSQSPSMSALQDTSPVSPICLTPTDAPLRTWEHSFSTPLEAHDAYYATELSQLRTESLPRLRHAARNVDKEWYNTKRTVTPDDVNQFELWWMEKKFTIKNLDDDCKRRSDAFGVSASGIGWTYAPNAQNAP